MKSRLFAALRPNLTESSDGANISEQSPSTARSGKFFFCCKRNIFYRKVWDMVEERALQLAPPPGNHFKPFSISKLPIGNFISCAFNNPPIYAPLQPQSNSNLPPGLLLLGLQHLARNHQHLRSLLPNASYLFQLPLLLTKAHFLHLQGKTL